jgi:hypothetical protein
MLKELILFVGDVSEELSAVAKKFDPSAILLNNDNYNHYFEKSISVTNTFYTSLGDLNLSIDKIFLIFYNADKIYYYPPDKWSDGKKIDLCSVTTSIHGLTEYLLSIVNKLKNNVENLNLSYLNIEKFISTVDCRKNDNPQLWVAGCSIADGYGVDKKERFGQLIADELNIPVSFLTSPGSSIEWAGNQILLSDIRENDIVVWGLTQESRFEWWSDITNAPVKLQARRIEDFQKNYKNILHLTEQSAKNIILDCSNQIYKSLQKIYQVINFSKKIKFKLLVVGLIDSDTLTVFLNDCNSYIRYVNINGPFIYVDTSDDNIHPGPKQHQLFADFCLDQFRERNFIEGNLP